MLGSPRRPRTAALPVNSRTLYPLSYREKGAATCCRRWNVDSTDGFEPTRAGRRQFCRLPPSTTWLRRVRNFDDGGGARTRTADLRFWKPALCPLSYAPSGSVYGLVPRARFERATSGFVDRRSGPAELTRHVIDDAERRQHRACIRRPWRCPRRRTIPVLADAEGGQRPSASRARVQLGSLGAAGGNRTPDARTFNPTFYLLNYRGSDLAPRAGVEPAASG
jgi:hypothetical protein